MLLLQLASTIPRIRADEPAAGWPAIEVESPFRVYAVDDDDEEGCRIPLPKATAMRDAGFTKVACPFGAVLIGATDSYPEKCECGSVERNANARMQRVAFTVSICPW